ncbi:MAG TPA: hypothetical protein VNN21_02970 [Dehalococcoidia bacterium]|nr:hypothetical protein [Dehalococcoidia bacterium]
MLIPPKAQAAFLSAGLFLAAACASNAGRALPPDGTPAPPASPTASPSGLVPAPPSDVRISGPLPDLHTPVPPGEGELNRVTVTWQDNSPNETGFRLFRDCEGTVSPALDVEANTTSYGPFGPCRPGRVGVAAFNLHGQSPIAWSP